MKNILMRIKQAPKKDGLFEPSGFICLHAAWLFLVIAELRECGMPVRFLELLADDDNEYNYVRIGVTNNIIMIYIAIMVN